ncbi:hypothetical protein [Salmonella enterica]|uniref:hypothetical protein n=1 Tax=Salmonella enterica TaxID=28901 RepID=UPI0035BE3F42
MASLGIKCREVRVPRPETLELAGSAPHVTDDFVRARCLTAMRIAMNEKLHARIIVGGRLTGYSGRMPGIIEEASLALRESIPLFIVGGFGGAAGLLTDLVAGQALESGRQPNSDRPGNPPPRGDRLCRNRQRWGRDDLRVDDGLPAQGRPAVAAVLVADGPVAGAGTPRAGKPADGGAEGRRSLSHHDRLVGPRQHARLCGKRRASQGHAGFPRARDRPRVRPCRTDYASD